MKRILYLEHNTDGTVGGSHLCLLDICKHLDKSHFHPIVCFFEKNSLVKHFESAGAEIIYGKAPTAWHGLPFLPRLVNRPLSIIINLIRTLVLRTSKWIHLLVRRKIDLVHINNACGYDHDLMLACRLIGIPCIVHERGLQPIIDFRSRYFANHTNGIIAISDAVSNNLKKFGVSSQNIIRINDSIDPARLIQQEKEKDIQHRLNIPEDSIVIGIVGNIKPWKGQIYVVEAFGLLQQSFPNMHCILVGNISDKSYENDILKLAKCFNIDPTKLHFTGYEQQPTDLMRIMDIVIHASIDPEPFGIVLLEAMAITKPLIASAAGAPLEIVIDNNTGILVEPKNSAELANKIDFLLSNKEISDEIARQGNKRFTENYTISNAINKIESVYNNILGV